MIENDRESARETFQQSGRRNKLSQKSHREHNVMPKQETPGDGLTNYDQIPIKAIKTSSLMAWQGASCNCETLSLPIMAKGDSLDNHRHFIIPEPSFATSAVMISRRAAPVLAGAPGEGPAPGMPGSRPDLLGRPRQRLRLARGARDSQSP